MRKSLLKNSRAQRLRRHTLLSFLSSSLIFIYYPRPASESEGYLLQSILMQNRF